tara:strand:+ start:228 stop:782 length:555 start_codon:yes stop_codon:yes gene_type:complete
MRIIIKAVRDIRRKDNINYLRRMLPTAEWCWDRKRDAMDTFIRAMRMAGDDPCIHLEDDIVLAKDFYRKITNAIKEHPDNVIQFFSMRKADLEVGSRWDNNYLMNQCHYNPAGYSNLIADFFTDWDKKETNASGTDLMLCDFLKSRKEKYWIHVPSLVDHRVGVSMIDPRRASTNRQSKTFTEY